MKKYIKTFMTISPASLDKQVNEFLSTLDLEKVNAEFQYRTYHYKHSVMIIVTNNNVNSNNDSDTEKLSCKAYHYNNIKI